MINVRFLPRKVFCRRRKITKEKRQKTLSGRKILSLYARIERIKELFKRHLLEEKDKETAQTSKVAQKKCLGRHTHTEDSSRRET